jgi:hypothetical protein
MKTLLSLVACTLVAALVPALASSADPASTVQADLTQLSTDVKTLHDTLLPDLTTITSAAQNGDKAGTRAAVAKWRADRRSVWPLVMQDRHQLRLDVKSAKAAGVTGLKDTVKSAVAANQALLKEVRDAAQQARAAVKALRGSST